MMILRQPWFGPITYPRRFSKAELKEIDREATELFDRLNPNWETKVTVGKTDCIKRILAARRARADDAQ